MADSAILEMEVLGFPFKTLDPFLFCVHHVDAYPKGNEKMGPVTPLTGRRLGMDFEVRDGFRMYHGHVVPGFPRHPHRGFETITALRSGYVDHADSLGATARFGPGDAQWMTAGGGIEHSEMFPLRERDDDNPMELFQIWLNLPKRSKMVEPYFRMLWSEDIPRRQVRDKSDLATEVTVIAGRFHDDKAPAPPPDSWASDAKSDIAVWTIKIPAGGHFTLPPAPKGVNRSLYFVDGDHLMVDEQEVPAYHRVTLRAEASPELVAGAGGADLLLLQGRPIGEPVVHHGPFVMNTEQEIHQAMADYRRDQFGRKWPWGKSDPVHPRESGRFAKHADGKVERKA